MSTTYFSWNVLFSAFSWCISGRAGCTIQRQVFFPIFTEQRGQEFSPVVSFEPRATTDNGNTGISRSPPIQLPQIDFRSLFRFPYLHVPLLRFSTLIAELCFDHHLSDLGVIKHAAAIMWWAGNFDPAMHVYWSPTLNVKRISVPQVSKCQVTWWARAAVP